MNNEKGIQFRRTRNGNGGSKILLRLNTNLSTVW